MIDMGSSPAGVGCTGAGPGLYKKLAEQTMGMRQWTVPLPQLLLPASCLASINGLCKPNK